MDREPIIEIGETVIGLEKGDITNAKVDAIVNPANVNLVLGVGVAGVIAKKGGSTIQRECDDYAPLEPGDAARTRAGLLPAKFVIHAVVLDADGNASVGLISEATRSALTRAEEIGLKRIAFPAMGTGVGKLPYGDSADAMLTATLDYLETRDVVRLLEITFVLYDDDAYGAFRGALQKRL
ncbi:MAG: macro domain-containing protein [Candidatus Coatesbacteria bacterium]|nr:MAG: macro domain-containing protein [Candidatus Coatesbacteria bacterium]